MCRIRTKGWKFTPDKFVEYKGFESKPPNRRKIKNHPCTLFEDSGRGRASNPRRVAPQRFSREAVGVFRLSEINLSYCI